MRRPLLVVVLAVIAVGSAAWAYTGMQARDDASRALTQTRTALATRRHQLASVRSAAHVTSVASSTVAPEVAAALGGARAVAGYDEQEALLVRAAYTAVIAGDVAGYNRAVNARNALDAPHDFVVDALRERADAISAALAAAIGTEQN